MNMIIAMLFALGVFAEDWTDNYKGAHYVLATLLIFGCLFIVLIGLAALFAVVVTLREWLIKRKGAKEASVEKNDTQANTN
ncbi:hypothetical protein KM1_028410 [Entamoeba histolytica HM-3:IMSS]|uniref:Single tm domain protein n=2 Tax=Entamoeba histolytica TaxID=5759 RepID=A0A175JTI6_ENTHI|nr:hypothetical protein KM1_028410 [Entamoeba histolytica HM-3:IMSS]GAT97079.1 single tm domain protein [Entamoeba histolytica]